MSMLKRKLEQHQRQQLARACHATDNASINFSSNDYLALSKHPTIIQAFKASANKYGVGSCASAQVGGYTNTHQELEAAFADKLQRERALLFNSGYHANLGVINTLASRNSTIIADKYCHASIIDAIVLSRATHRRYRHNDLAHANDLQIKHPDALVVTESVFSIHGSLTDIATLAAQAKRHHNFLMVDDAHGIGILGKTGGGICEHFALSQQDVPCLIAPLGKAFASMGAIVAGSNELIEALMQFARPHRYSTALPAAICAATLTAMKVMRAETWRLAQLRARIAFFIKAALERDLLLSSYDLTPIKSIIVDSNHAALSLQNLLMQKGMQVACIRPPTIPTHLSMIRISLQCNHTEKQIIHLLDEISGYVNRKSN